MGDERFEGFGGRLSDLGSGPATAGTVTAPELVWLHQTHERLRRPFEVLGHPPWLRGLDPVVVCRRRSDQESGNRMVVDDRCGQLGDPVVGLVVPGITRSVERHLQPSSGFGERTIAPFHHGHEQVDVGDTGGDGQFLESFRAPSTICVLASSSRPQTASNWLSPPIAMAMPYALSPARASCSASR